MDRTQLTQILLQIVSERTGYPPEMLDIDLDIEADLGIDSIKRVEIVGALQLACLPASQQRTHEAMEKLTGIKTLRGIVDLISNSIQPCSADRPAAQAAKPGEEPTGRRIVDGVNSELPLPRFLLTPVDTPLSEQPIPHVTDHLFLMTDDERGVAQSLAVTLQRHGARVVLVRMGQEQDTHGQDCYTADLTDPAAAAVLVQRVRQQHGPIAGVIHLLPLKAGMTFEEMDLTAWRARLRLETNSLFYLARSVAVDLDQTEKAERRWLIVATGMGGAGATEEPRPFLPSQGGVAGLVKTLALEWPQVRHKVVDFDVDATSPAIAAQLLAEMAAQEDEVEVRYTGRRRIVLRAKPAPVAVDASANLSLDAQSVVLVTGGARGITAEVALELARLHRPILLLVGRSPLPKLEEASATAGRSGLQEIKGALIEQMQQTGEPVTPARIEAAYLQLCKEREIRNNLAGIRKAGARVHYYQVDVRDENAFGRLIDEIYQTYGRIDGVIHGAGVIEDRLVVDKSPDSFERVLDTKAASSFILSRKIRAELLRFFILFSSVAGRFGNRGQSDYAAANEVLNQLAVYLDRQWPGRVVSINWGPWAKTGMVSAEVERQFAERAVQLIDPEAGRRAMAWELQYGRKGETQVIYGDGPWRNHGR